MLKWILGAIGLLIVILAGTCWYGYKKLTSGGDTARVAIASNPDRVWRYLTMPDSMRAWQDSGTTISVSSDSALAVGDTVLMASQGRSGPAETSRRMLWIVTRLDSPTVVVWAARDDSTGVEILRRTDSVAVEGDSVIVLSRFATPLTDSLRAGDSTGALAGKFITGAGKLATSAMRTMAESELGRLKVVLEGP